MDWNNFITSLAIAFVVALGGGISSLLIMAYKTYQKVDTIQDKVGHRGDENKIQFKALFLIIQCLRTGKSNGELHAVEEEMRQYLRDSAIK